MSRRASPLIGIAQRVNADRVLERLRCLGSIGAEGLGGVTRIAFSDEDIAAMDVVSGWFDNAGLTSAYDSFGNLFGSTDHNAPDTEVSLAGSHLDTVRQGGRFDGALGVIAAIESILAMRECDLLPERPLEVVVWRCEEPVRFPKGKVGSSLFAGRLSIDALRPIDPGFDLAEVLRRTISGNRRDSSRLPNSYLELHIEQGRKLEKARVQVGVVTAVAAPTRLLIHIEGQADHSGATPMEDRRDALCAAAEIVLGIEQAALDEAPYGSVATTADLTCEPGVINVIPGETSLIVDVRGTRAHSINRLVSAIHHIAGEVSRVREVSIDLQVLSEDQPTQFDARMIDLLSNTLGELGVSAELLPSGAGHDAQPLASLCSTGMLFVPSVDGISHSPEEYTRDDNVVAGVRSLAACWWRVAQEDFQHG